MKLFYPDIKTTERGLETTVFFMMSQMKVMG